MSNLSTKFGMKIVNVYSVDGLCEAFNLTKKSYKSVDLFRLVPVGTIAIIQHNKDSEHYLTDLTDDYGTIIVVRAGNNYSGAIFFSTYLNVHKVMGFASSGDCNWYQLNNK